MMTNAKIATAVVGGYLLGRTRKGKLALSVGMLLAGRKLRLNPQELAKAAAGSPLLSGLSDQVRRDLVEGTKSAAGSALEARMNTLADSLRERSAALEGGGEKDGDEDAGEPADEGPADGDDADAGEERSAPRRARAERPARAAKKRSAGTARKAAGTSRGTKRTARTAKAARGGRDE